MKTQTQVTLDHVAELLNVPLKSIHNQCPKRVIKAGVVEFAQVAVFVHPQLPTCNIHRESFRHKRGCMRCLVGKQTRVVVPYEEFKARRFMTVAKAGAR